MSFSLIVPAAANKPEFVGDRRMMPNIFKLNEYGLSLCVAAVMELDHTMFDAIYFTVLKEHDAFFGVVDLLNAQLAHLNWCKAKVVVLDYPTTSQAETVYETIRQENITGPIFIKDADSVFNVDIQIQNGVVVYPLENLTSVNPQHKSYVAVDDMMYITNIIEKLVIDHYFNAGGYAFEDAAVFEHYYNRFFAKPGLYMSHIVYAMLLDGHIFRPFVADKYIDCETI